MAMTQIVGRRGRGNIMKAPKRWQPAPPKVRFTEQGKFLFTRLALNVAPGVTMNFISRVDLELIERDLRDGIPDEISGIFGSIFKGIKKAVKTVGKATGLNKVVKIAGKVLNNPLIKAIVPGAAMAAAGAKVAADVAKATGLAGGKRKGRAAKAAKYYLQRAAVTAERAKLDKPARDGAVLAGGKAYKLIVTPM
jgi:hypothetical protein